MLLHEFSFQDYTIKVLDSLIDTEFVSDWSVMSSACNHLRPEMKILLENAKPKDLQFRYLFIYHNVEPKKVCGIVYFQFLNFDHNNFNFTNKNLFHYLALVLLRIRSFKVLLAGSLFAVDFSPLSFDKNKIGPADIIEIIDHFSKVEKYDIIVLKDLPDEFNSVVREYKQFSHFETDLTMQLELNPNWQSFKDYEKALTHKYGQRVRKIKKNALHIERREINKQDFVNFKHRINELFSNVAKKQTIRMGIVDEVYFEEMYNSLGDEFFITGYFLDDKLIAFASHILYKEKLEVHYIGIDYTLNQECNLYFNILYDGIELALKHSKKSLELGRTAREAKAVLGCHPIYFNDYIKVSNGLVRWMLNLLQSYFNTGIGEGWKKRHPFKTFAEDINVK